MGGGGYLGRNVEEEEGEGEAEDESVGAVGTHQVVGPGEDWQNVAVQLTTVFQALEDLPLKHSLSSLPYSIKGLATVRQASTTFT